jgi:hypothetical protein
MIYWALLEREMEKHPEVSSVVQLEEFNIHLFEGSISKQNIQKYQKRFPRI